MKAAVLIGYGGVDQLELRDDVPEPWPGPGEVKVRVAATSLNPIDWKLRRGTLRAAWPLRLPAVLGRDAAGQVVEVGAGVTRLRRGDRVAGLVTHGYAEFVVAREEAWARVPRGMGVAEAAAIPLVALTGVQLVDEALGLGPTNTALVTGAVGAVGRVATFVAKERGVRVWAGVRRAQREVASGLGAMGVVALDDATDVGRLPALDAIADTVGGPTLESLLDKVRRGGTLGVLAGEPSGAQARGLEVRHVSVHPDPQRLSAVLEAVAQGALLLPVTKLFALAQIRDAHLFAERGGHGGKVVVEI
jgi:NADPH:quinone reductase-like Zn-dependent oxidoreductase